MNKYEYLKQVYECANRICDPIDYIGWQKKLLHALAEYIIEKDYSENSE